MTDNIDNTALIDATLSFIKKPSILNIFFERDDLDYLHKNKKGQDALVLKNRNTNRNNETTQITDRNEYLTQLKAKNSS